jgi:predicted metal-dependent hydrolase
LAKRAYFLVKKKSVILKTENVKVVVFREIGEVSFIRKPSVRSMKISLKPFRGVLVTMPQFVSYEAAGKFVESKAGWIRKQQEKMKKYERRVTLFTRETVFRTKDHVLSIGTHEKPTIQTIIKNQVIHVNHPDFAEVTDLRIQKAIRRGIVAALTLEANKHLPPMMEKLAGQFGFSYGQVSFRNNKSRWGSCSHDNRISLNIHLMRLPGRLQEYIILHELCHTVHKHHQKSFWLLLDKLTGGRARELDRELNVYSPQVF